MDDIETILREAYVSRSGLLWEDADAQFDAWLAGVRAAAWEEGFAAGAKNEEDAYWQPGVPEKRNPYGVSLDR